MDETEKRMLKHEIPRGARILSRTEAINHQMKIIRNWKPWTDVWPFKFGMSILGGITAFSGIYINHRFRRKMKLRNYGLIPTTLALAFAPTFLTVLFQSQIIMSKVILFQIACPFCLTSKAAALQTLTGVFLPLMLAPIANFALAADSGRLYVPHPSEIGKTIKMLNSVYGPMLPKIALIFTLHALLAGFITEKEIKSYINIQEKLYFLDQDRKDYIKE